MCVCVCVCVCGDGVGAEVINLLIKRKWSYCSTVGQRGQWTGSRRLPGEPLDAVFLEPGVMSFDKFSLPT